MTELANQAMWRIQEASLILAFTGIVVVVVLRGLKCRAPVIHQWAWGLVVVQGVVLIHVPLKFRWENTPTADRPLGVSSGTVTTTKLAAPASIVESVTKSSREATSSDKSAWDSAPQQPQVGYSWLPLLVLTIWGTGIVILIVRRVWAYRRFVKLADCRRCHNESWALELHQALQALGLEQRISLYLSHGVGPVLCRWPGVSRWPGDYRIIVPETLWSHLTSAERAAVLRHEIAHFQRRDIFRMLIVQSLALPHWFNPIAWFALREFERATELSCDDVVCSAGHKTSISYAHALLKVGQREVCSPMWSAAFGAGVTARRIRRILARPAEGDSRSRKTAVACVLAILLVGNVVRVELSAQDAQLGSAQDKTVQKEATQAATGSQVNASVVSDEEFEKAAQALRDMGGFVRSYYERSSPRHWVQIILESRAPGQAATFGPVDESKSPSFSDDDLMHVKMLTLDADSHVHLRGGTFTSEGLQHLAGTKITRLELGGSKIGDAEALELGKLEHLDELTLDASRLSVAGLDAIAKCERLEAIGYIQDMQANPGAIKVLHRLPNLQSLALRGELDAQTAAALNACQTLKTLRLQISSPKAADAFLSLNCLGSLTKADISGNAISEKLIVRLANQAVNLEQLYLRRQQAATLSAMRALAGMNKLEVLALDGSNVTDAGVALLLPLKRLRWLDLSSTQVTDRSLLVAGNLPELKHLGLRGTNVTSGGLEHLARLNQLTYLNVQSTYVKSIPTWMNDRPRLHVTYDKRSSARPAEPEIDTKSQLALAVATFNTEAGKHRVGKFEPPLTLDEVIAAIRSWDRVAHPVDDETYAIFQFIADTRQMPEGAKFSSTSGWQNRGFRYRVWWINLDVMTGERSGYTYRIRSRLISSQKLPR